MTALAHVETAEPLQSQPFFKTRASDAASYDPGKNPDWAGLWFKLDELVLGDFIDMRAGTLVPGSDEINWRHLPHSEYDGLSGFVHTLRKEGIDAKFPRPSLGVNSKPSWWQRAAAVLRLWFRPLAPAAAWKALSPSWAPPPSGCGPSRAIAAGSLSAEQAKKISARTRGLGISLNSLLFAALARASGPEIGPGPRIWCMPINMRGPVKLPRESDNHVSFIDLELAPDVTAEAVQQQVKEAFKRGDHWGNWLIMNVGRIVGFQGMRRIYEYNLEQTEGRTGVGTMSNLGSWKGIGDWYVAPGAAYGAICCAVIVCDGKINLTLEAHPSVATDPAWPRALLARWIAEIEAEAGLVRTHEHA